MIAGIPLRHVPGRYGIARLAPDAPIPAWTIGAGLTSIIRTDDEMTIVCAADRIPAGIEVDAPWVCMRSIGPFDFHATGIVQSLVTPLSKRGIGVFVLCTFDGEHLLVSERDAKSAFAALTEAGHKFDPEASPI